MSHATHKIKCNCPTCRAEFNLSGGYRGKRVKCYVCGEEFTVPLDSAPDGTAACMDELLPVPLTVNIPPIVRTHSHGLAAVLSLILPGAGHAYCGHFGTALLVMFALVPIYYLAMLCFAHWLLAPLGVATILLFALNVACNAYYLEPQLPRPRLTEPADDK